MVDSRHTHTQLLHLVFSCVWATVGNGRRRRRGENSKSQPPFACLRWRQRTNGALTRHDDDFDLASSLIINCPFLPSHTIPTVASLSSSFLRFIITIVSSFRFSFFLKKGHKFPSCFFLFLSSRFFFWYKNGLSAQRSRQETGVFFLLLLLLIFQFYVHHRDESSSRLCCCCCCCYITFMWFEHTQSRDTCIKCLKPLEKANDRIDVGSIIPWSPSLCIL